MRHILSNVAFPSSHVWHMRTIRRLLYSEVYFENNTEENLKNDLLMCAVHICYFNILRLFINVTLIFYDYLLMLL
jgi:hypothetical protein